MKEERKKRKMNECTRINGTVITQIVGPETFSNYDFNNDDLMGK